ncbi:GtrA family protein [Paenibacillus beijingensis]|uniref:GtrA family protein n=1 Tax=Paenibacillus beijingensis TaxID=1126833 RepID=UPI000695EE06|nr:GtrA family protein [Paenibacillus beijingensis]
MGTLIKFALTGCLNTVIDYAVFGLLNALLGVNYLLAQTISFACGTINSYLVNRKWTFQRRGGVSAGEALKFLAVNGFTFGISTAVLAILHSGLQWNALAAKAIAVVIATAAGYAANRYWVFREAETLVSSETAKDE